MKFNYDIIVIGAGHAGCEAAHAAAKLGSSTLLITMDMNKIAQMSCNPAVGGIAKGQIVREIDALGGAMGIVTDRSSIQFRLLNRSKGPAMWSPRSQCDRTEFIRQWRNVLDETDNLYIWQDTVTRLSISDGRVTGVETALGVAFSCQAVVLTAGTFLNGLLHVGQVHWPGGRISEPASNQLTQQIVALGHPSERMKTGTPVRIDSRTIDFAQTVEQKGETDFHRFSFLPFERNNLTQRSCYIVYTNPAVHDVLRDALPRSPLYNGQITSIGPRYCPSIESKIVTFADKTEHQLFIEPEGAQTNECYLNGFSSSLPWDVQIEALSKIPALRNAHIYRPGYAIEYDFFDPTHLYPTLRSKHVDGLYLAGQVNGTTGYEEAAGQGLVAGVNAHNEIYHLPEFTLSRDQAYIGVLIDDLVTKGVDEPYRMFTSRAEHRILLRQDNADQRLTPIGLKLGLADTCREGYFRHKTHQIESLRKFFDTYTVKPDMVNDYLQSVNESPLRQSCRLRDLITRPNVTCKALMEVVARSFDDENGNVFMPDTDEPDVVEAFEIEVKYAGYIEREKLLADKIHRLEDISLSSISDYEAIHQISTEARQKLSRIRPATIGQASRIPGVSPSDIQVLLLLLGR